MSAQGKYHHIVLAGYGSTAHTLVGCSMKSFRARFLRDQHYIRTLSDPQTEWVRIFSVKEDADRPLTFQLTKPDET